MFKKMLRAFINFDFFFCFRASRMIVNDLEIFENLIWCESIQNTNIIQIRYILLVFIIDDTGKMYKLLKNDNNYYM